MPSKDQKQIFDCGPLGSSYQPGHAHCDLHRYAFSYEGRPLIVDSGLGNYRAGKLRKEARSIYVHNSLVVNGLEQAELWAVFRMGRRVKPEGKRFEAMEDRIVSSYRNNLNKKSVSPFSNNTICTKTMDSHRGRNRGKPY